MILCELEAVRWRLEVDGEWLVVEGRKLEARGWKLKAGCLIWAGDWWLEILPWLLLLAQAGTAHTVSKLCCVMVALETFPWLVV